MNTDGTLPTFAFFNYLFWDNTLNLSDFEKSQILQHEKAHIRQKHSYDIILIEVLKALFWFNPLLYCYKYLLEETHEFAADRAVAGKGQVSAYTQVLARIVFQKMGLELTSSFNKNKVLKRIKMLEHQQHTKWFKFLMPIPAAALLFFIFSFEPVTLRDEVKVGEIEFLGDRVGLDVNARPFGGFEKWNEFLEEQIEYPESALLANITGEIKISFTVNKGGKLEDLYFDQALGYETEKAVIRALERSTLWNPAIANGERIDTRVSLPITFKKG